MNVQNLLHLYAAYFVAATTRQNALEKQLDALEHDLMRRIRELTAERNHLLAQLDRVDDDD